MAAKRFTYQPGDQPVEPYTIECGLGIGAFGEVYRATSDAGREVALKLIRNDMDVELRGARTCMDVSGKCSHLVQIFDIVQDDDTGQSWIVMEYIRGQTLASLIGRFHGLPQDKVEHCLQGIATAVDYLHDHGIIHRDLSPANIFIDEEDGLVKVGDFGFSKFITPSQRSKHTEGIGTMYYTAPEVFRGSYNTEVDIYAVGAILYEMLCGRPPFTGETQAEILMKHLTEEPNLSLIPDHYKGRVKRALEKDPSKRWRRASEMLRTAGAEYDEPQESLHSVDPVPSLTRTAYRGLTESFGITHPDEPQRRAIIGMNVGAVVLGLIGTLFGLIIWLFALVWSVPAVLGGYAVFGTLCGKIMADSLWDFRKASHLHLLTMTGWGVFGAVVGVFALSFGGLHDLHVPATQTAQAVAQATRPQVSPFDMIEPFYERNSDKTIEQQKAEFKAEQRQREAEYETEEKQREAAREAKLTQDYRQRKFELWLQYQFVWLLVSVGVGMLLGAVVGWLEQPSNKRSKSSPSYV